MNEITIDNCRLFNDDCFNVLEELEDGSIDAVITDMPFGITAAHWDKVPPLESLWNLLDKKTKPTANFIMFACGKFSIDLVNSRYAWYRYDWIWAKNNRVGFLNASKMPMRSHEQVLVFGRPGHRATSTYNPVKSPGGRVGMRSISRNPSDVYGFASDHVSVSDGNIHPSSVLAFPNDRGNNQQGLNLHPTQKPISLMEFLILTYTNKNDVVLDCFMGSGTTAVACARTNRRFIGIEREEKFFTMAVERLQAPQTANLLADLLANENNEHAGLNMFATAS